MLNEYEDSQKTRVNIAYVFDDNYAAITGVSILSLFENNRDLDEIHVYCLTPGLNDENIEKFSQLAQQYEREIEVVDISQKMLDFRSLGFEAHNMSFVSYSKLFCVDYVPDYVDKLIYLDSDTVILGSIRGILDKQGLLGLAKGGFACRTKDVIDYDAPFEVAVIVFDANQWRSNDCSEGIKEYISRSRTRFLVQDETIFNILFRDEIYKLPLEYCFGVIQCAFSEKDYRELSPVEEYTPEEISHAYANPIIIHADLFLGEKPWMENTIHPNKDLFDDWLDRSPWRYWKSVSRIPEDFLHRLERMMYQLLPRRIFYRIWNFGQTWYAKKQMKYFKRSDV